MSPESLKIAEIVDVYPEHLRLMLVEAVDELADVYRVAFRPTPPLAEMRRQYREAHPDEQAPDEDRPGNVISLADRRMGVPERDAS